MRFLQRVSGGAATRSGHALLRRRQRWGKYLGCAAGAVLFFGLYLASWVLVLEHQPCC